MQKQLYTPKDNGLYLSRFEHDACGVGLVANMRGEASHRIIEQGITVLKRLMHRGALGADPDTGDGAGLLIALPDAFFRAVVDFSLPEPGRYGVAMMFGGVGAEPAIENVIKREGGRILGWRQVPICADSIGEVARASVPCIRQLFLTTDTDAPEDEEINLYVIRRCLEKSIPDLYICSMSSRTIVYKGLLQGGQLDSFYSDLSDIRMVSPLVLVHQRYSTNTFPTWALAQPFRYLAHNGEINTLRGNLNAQRARENLLKSSVLGARLNKLLPLINGAQSDSACLDNMLELLVAAGRPLEHALLMLIPQAWGENYHMGRDVRAFFEYHSALMEPWDGPAAIVATDGRRAVALLDRNGLRPLRYTECYDGLFVLASEAGVLDLPQEQVRRKGRLKPGGILVLDIPRHLVLEDAEVKTALARSKPYRRWVEENRLSVRGLFTEITAAEPEADLIRNQVLFGYSREDVDIILSTMAGKGTEPIGSMGMEAAPAVLSDKPQL
ncbi:MAG: glutamate synthase subunit alpha, partial [Akkermansia sp.]|nr:glutamate synthase subunit alpha [Akkermansia sp.]